MRKILSLGLIIGITNLISAQNHKWELGTFIGVSSYNGDLVQNNIYDLNEVHLGYGLFVRNNFHPNLSFRANFLSGMLSGDDSNSSEFTENRGFKYTSPVTEISLQLEVDLLGHKRYKKDRRFKRMITSYLLGGIGYTIFDQSVDYNKSLNRSNSELLALIEDDERLGVESSKLSIPVGIGVKFDLSEKTTVGLEWGARAVFSDLIDGVSQSGDPNNNDWYSFGGATFAVRFGEIDQDKDGVPDSKDLCPLVAGPKGVNGCPDIDQDGIVDSEDQCPYDKGYIELKGCPDRDKDGIADKNDDCPNEAGILQYNGCPIQDADSDGVPDDIDQCPYEVGLAKRNGCPYSDRDKDGLEDNEDLCPDEAGFPFNKGCPDADNDGIIDKDDECPRIQGSSEFNGCPDFLKNGVSSISENFILFDESSHFIKADYYVLLDKLIELLRQYPDYKLRIEGYSDNQGNDYISQQLAERRAKSCYDYITALGIEKDRILYRGYGENKPIGDNSTLEGRALNRRVEFILYKSN